MTSSTCKDSVELLLEYLDGELNGERRARLEEHLGGCSPCEDFMKSYLVFAISARRKSVSFSDTSRGISRAIALRHNAGVAW